MVISRAFRTSFPASNALKSNMAANAEFQDLAASWLIIKFFKRSRNH